MLFGAIRRLAVLGLAGLLASCLAEPVSITILQIQRVDPASCVATADGAGGLARGRVDVAISRGYVVHPLVRNNMYDVRQVNQFNEADGRTQNTDVLLTEAVVELSALDELNANLPARRVVPFVANVLLNQVSAVGVEVLDAAMIEAIRQSPEFLDIDVENQLRPQRTTLTLIATIKYRGRTLDGNEVESNEVNFPITVCNGCSVYYPPEAEADGERSPNCLGRTDLEDIELPEISCPDYVGTDGFSVHCLQCPGFAADSFSRQLCQPPQGI